MSHRISPSEAMPADTHQDVTMSGPVLLARGYLPYERYNITFVSPDGQRVDHTRDVLRAGRVVGVLPIDVERDEVVLIQQFRLASHLATGKGNSIEIVAGYIEDDEPPAAAARRECLEEIGVSPRELLELFSFLPAPGTSDELATLFLAAVDASKVPEFAGYAAESEHTRPLRFSIDSALAALAKGTICNGYLILALQWLALNRRRLNSFVRQ
jgi:ADP-ribose pyrophosphatase